MTDISHEQQHQLADMFGERVTFEETERRLYGHDMATMPSMVKPLVGDTTPGAVVQPTGVDQLVRLLTWADRNRMPLTPRGKASSGYGGAVPIHNGVVVDYYFMKDVLAVDPQGQTVTVEPGISWEQLDRELAQHDLTLRLYPTSYPSSTVGGWLSQGGAGIGSYRYGYFDENVVSAKAVLPSGEVRDFAGEDLDLVSGAEGITGLLSEVTLRVAPRFHPSVIAVSIGSADDLQRLVEDIVAADLPVWSISFINPQMAELKNRAPERTHFGDPAETKIELPASYIVAIYCLPEAREIVEAGLGEMLERHRAVLNEGDRLTLLLHRHHDVEAGGAHVGDGGLQVGIEDLDHAAPLGAAVAPIEAEVADHFLQLEQTPQIFLGVVVAEFDQQDRFRRLAYEFFQRRLEQRNLAGEFDHRAVDQFDADGLQPHD